MSTTSTKSANVDNIGYVDDDNVDNDDDVGCQSKPQVHFLSARTRQDKNVIDFDFDTRWTFKDKLGFW